jgi:hypothetical protein
MRAEERGFGRAAVRWAARAEAAMRSRVPPELRAARAWPLRRDRLLRPFVEARNDAPVLCLLTWCVAGPNQSPVGGFPLAKE